MLSLFPDCEVRTGNRETLAENGFVNSKPMTLADALTKPGGGGDNSSECSRIIFSPVSELPLAFKVRNIGVVCGLQIFFISRCSAPPPPSLQNYLGPLLREFPCKTSLFPESKKFTLCIGREGFGIGMHKHNAAMFMLVEGRKKWYMGSSVSDPSHPGFYGDKSSHKCIQQPGELLFVPKDWYHEIFNLDEFTVGIQALPEDN